MAFIAAVILLCLYEYGLMLLSSGQPVSRVSLLAFGIIMAVAALAARLPTAYAGNIDSFFIALTLCGIFFVEILTPGRSAQRAANTLLGVMLIPWSLAHLINIRLLEPQGMYITYTMFITVWTSDTMAYFCGKAFGRHKLSPGVSPKKSWEGAIAGVIFGAGAALLCRDLFFPSYFTWAQAAALGALTAALGAVSDLAESLIKRGAGAKDSSNILPGHGGILDRFDSYLFIAPVLYYVLLWMKM
jgi:phosphatidate cytidylyltransferase